MSGFFFYDTETSGVNSRSQRIMQFAGVHTDKQLKVVGKPFNLLIKLTDEVLPEPEAIRVHGILPQAANRDGVSEPEFIKQFSAFALKPDLILAGFNNVRFDDEFVRQLMYRNLHDAYRWGWEDGRSRFDILDVARLTRALRPEGINWPLDKEGKPTNSLVPLAEANQLKHANAHDALSDVLATIELARLIREKQPHLFDWLLKLRKKDEVTKLVDLDDPRPFVYCSGRYSSDHLKTTIVFPLAPDASNPSGVLVYDLRFDPEQFFALSPEELQKRAFGRQPEGVQRLPVKTLSINRCPAIAPISVLDEASEQRIKLTPGDAQKNLKKLSSNKHFADMVRTLWEEKPEYQVHDDVDFRLYDGFVSNDDAKLMADVRARDEDKLADYQPAFADARLSELLFRYKARQFPGALNDKEQLRWRDYRIKRLQDGVPGQPSYEDYLKRTAEVGKTHPEIAEALIEYAKQLLDGQETPKLF